MTSIRPSGMRRSRRRAAATRCLVPAVATALVTTGLFAGTSPAAAAAAPAPVPVPAAAPAADWRVPRLAVMPLGDSITRGVGSSTGSGYRVALRDRLTGHADDLRFVGSVRTDGQDNEGHPGWMIDDLADNIDRWLAETRPNVVTLNIGTNDIDADFHSADAPARLGALVDRITAAAPGVTVLVSSLVPNNTKDDPARNERVKQYNSTLPGLVAERQRKGLHVGYVDMGAVTPDDIGDRLHPKDAGYAKMADAFYGGIARAAADGWIRPTVDVRPAPPAAAPQGDYKVDINGDGRADYLVVDDDGSVRAWRNDGGDTGKGWAPLGRIATGDYASGTKVRFADIDGDGRADYLILDKDGSVRAFLNNASAAKPDDWKRYGRLATGIPGAPADRVRFADVNGDRKADYLVVDDDGSVRAWLNNGGDQGKGWISAGLIATGDHASGTKVRFADVDGDGKADYLVVNDDGSVHAWINTGAGVADRWSDAGLIATGTKAAPGSAVRFADVDGDGKADYLAVDEDGSVHAWINKGAGRADRWSDAGTIATGTGKRTGSRVHI
ncbi:FG-GAP-like repeat-containing protein [Streptomyces sp. NPDC049555]|uniref:FG-GAP-like repeat-containing protein n=1 Tax=Streptomyces sp. NPDC049555 TaxID=3154930 RepID=UPI003417088D